MAGGTQQPTLYEILGVTPDADEETIRKASKKAARKYHPDLAPGLDAMFLMVQHAGQVLTDSSQRSAYDASIGNRRAPTSGPSPQGEAPPPNSSGPRPGDHAPPRTEEPPPGPGDTEAGLGTSVPADQYSGVLPRESHDVAAMPWIQQDDDQTPPKIAHAEMPWWGVMLLLIVGVLAVFVGMTGHPLMLFPIVFLVVFLLLRQFGWGHSAIAWAVGTLPMLGAAVLPLLWGLVASGADGTREFLFGLVAVLGGILLIGTHTRYLRRRGWIRSKFAREGFSWGEPGAGLNDAIGKFGVNEVMDGVEGETLTAAEIGYFLGAIPGVRLVNGLSFPGSAHADVDHAVVCGDKIAFIDSKAWAPSTFTMSRDWTTIREDLPNGTWRWRETNMHVAVDAYVKALRAFGVHGAKVRGYIVVHPKTLQKPLGVDSQAASEFNRMVTSRELIAELGAWFTEDPEQAATVDRRMLSFLVGARRA